MTAMGWGAVWQAASAAFGAEAAEVRLVIVAVAAFFVLMILIGLSHAFRSAAPKTEAPIPEQPKRIFAAAPVAELKPAPQPLRVLRPAPHFARKSAKRTINRHRPLRPQIRRAQKPQIEAPYSPLPPRA
jgi:hypothetical protein